MLADQTSAHDPLVGYVPDRMTLAEADALLASGRLDAYLSVLQWGLKLANVPVAPELVGPDVVNTMPEHTLRAFADYEFPVILGRDFAGVVERARERGFAVVVLDAGRPLRIGSVLAPAGAQIAGSLANV